MEDIDFFYRVFENLSIQKNVASENMGETSIWYVYKLSYCKFGIFREDFIFAKLRICEVSWKWNPREMAKSLWSLLV